MLAASDEGTKGRCKEAYRKEKIRVKRCIIQGVPEFNGTGIQKPPYYFETDLTFLIF